jgi:hypothetical protein
MTPDLADDVVMRSNLSRKRGQFEILAWVRGERSVYVAAEKRQRNVRLIDFTGQRERLPRHRDGNTPTAATPTGPDVYSSSTASPSPWVQERQAQRHGRALIQRFAVITRNAGNGHPQVFDFTQIIEFFYGVVNLDPQNIFPWKHLDKITF